MQDPLGQPTHDATELSVAATTPATDSPVTASLVPDWLVNVAAVGWRVLAVAALLLVAWVVANILWLETAAIAVAGVIAAVLAPFVLRLRAGGRSRNAAAGIVWIIAVLVGTGVVLLVGLFLFNEATTLAARVDTGLAALQQALAELRVPGSLGGLARSAHDIVAEATSQFTAQIVASAGRVVAVLILAVFLLFFFLRDGDKAWVWLFQATSQAKRERVTRAGDDALTRVGGYLRGMTALSAVVAVTNLLFMLLLGVPHAIPLAVLAFLAGYIPYFGGIFASAITLLVTYASLGAGPAILLLVLMGIRGVVLGSFVRPVVYGRTVDIHPALVLVALPVGYQLAGVVGLFAAVPLTAVVLTVAGAALAILEPFPPPHLPGLVPAWLDRAAQTSWRLLVAIALIALVTGVVAAVPLVIVPVVLALVLAATLDPLVGALERRGWARGRAGALAVGGGLLVIVGLSWLAFASLFQQTPGLGNSVLVGADRLNEVSGGQLGLPVAAVADVVRAVVESVGAAVSGAVALATVVVLGTLLAFYFLRDGARLWSRAMARVRAAVRTEVDAAGRRAFGVLGGYMIGTAAVSFVGAASQFAIMVVLGLPLALPVFVLSFLLSFIPYIGSFISTGIAFLIAVAVGSTTDVIIMGIWTAVFNIVQGNVASPLVYGRTVKIHPAIVLVAIPAGGAVAGIAGMFIVIPAIGAVATTWRTVVNVLGMRARQPGLEAETALATPAARAAPDPPASGLTNVPPDRD